MIVSIDIGTSYSSICMLGPEGKAQPIDISTGASMYGSSYSLPTAVFVEDSGEIIVGQAAMNSRKHKPQNFRMEFKRNLGEDVPILLGERSFRPEELYTEIFRHMKACAEKVGGEPIEKTYLTCPASYGELRKGKLCSAAKAAGLFDIELVDEPTAAAMCYCAEGYIQDGQILLVYDFGGGTFDVSLIRYQNGKFELLTEPEGLEQCGGIDMDRLIYQDMLASVESDVLDELKGNNLHYLRFTSQLAELSVKAKHHLTSAKVFEEDIQIGFDMVPYRLTVEKFNEMIAPLVGQTIQTCRRAVEAADLDASKLSAVLMAGGTSRVPLVQEMVRSVSNTASVLRVMNLELAVAQGALNYRMMCTNNTVSQSATEMPETMEYTADECFKRGEEAEERQAYEEAVGWYQKAADLGHAEAMYHVGVLYDIGKGVPEDEQQAFQYYYRSAEMGFVDAMDELGFCYGIGVGVPEDKEQSYQWYHKACLIYLESARQGDVGAMDQLGQYYELGKGVPKDKKQSHHWYHEAFLIYREAAYQGDVEAMYMLGFYYKDGDGVPRDAEQSSQWFRKAFQKELEEAQLGDADCMYRVGYDYEEGLGVSKNLKMAIYWYQQAAKAGNKLAEDKLQKLEALGE